MRIPPSIVVLLAILATAPAVAFSAAPTFNQHIAPIIYRNCSACHRPGEAAPFPLLSYDDTRKKGKTIAKVIAARAMPPWKAEPASYPYRNERRLAETEISLVEEWVRTGMAEGAGDKPAPPQFADGWRLGKPDLVVEMPAAYHVPAEGPDIYRNLAVPLGLSNDQWLIAIDMRPSARAVVHHVLYFADPRGRAHLKSSQGPEPGFRGMQPGRSALALGGWAVGAQPHFLPDGFSLPVPKGSDLVVQYHFHPTGKPETEKSLVGLYFAKKPPERTLTRIQMPPAYSLFSGLDIPAGEADFVVRDSYTLPVAADAIAIGGHAHYICKQMKMMATLPGGEVKTLLHIKDWDFAWQDRYYFQQLVALPKGTRLDAEIHWDNSAGNPRNPSSPPVRVSWGEESKDEMGSISLVVVPHEQADHPILQGDLDRRRRELVIAGMRADPSLALKLQQLLAE